VSPRCASSTGACLIEGLGFWSRPPAPAATGGLVLGGLALGGIDLAGLALGGLDLGGLDLGGLDLGGLDLGGIDLGGGALSLIKATGPWVGRLVVKNGSNRPTPGPVAFNTKSRVSTYVRPVPTAS
jgi:hypothetical protein